jgi:hypothetical protein
MRRASKSATTYTRIGSTIPTSLLHPPRKMQTIRDALCRDSLHMVREIYEVSFHSLLNLNRGPVASSQ